LLVLPEQAGPGQWVFPFPREPEAALAPFSGAALS
jgi:hypothetical protein